MKYEEPFGGITPFAKLYDENFAVPDTGTVNFTLYDDGWKSEKYRNVHLGFMRTSDE